MATKRRDSGSGSVYQDRRGRWRGTVDLGWEYKGRGEDGTPQYRRKRKVVTGKTKADAVAKLKSERSKLDTGGTVATNIPKAADWLTHWIDEVRPNQRTRKGPIRPRTLASDRTYVHEYLIPFFGRYKLDELEQKPALVAGFHTWMRKKEKQRGKGTLEESTVLRAHAIGSKALDDARKLYRYITTNPFKELERPGTGNTEVSFLDASGAAKMIEHDPDGRWMFALLTGKRQGERLGLRWSMLDLEEGTADVSWQLQRISYRHGCDGDCGHRFGGNCPDRALDVADGWEGQQLDGGLCLTRPKGAVHVIPLVPSIVEMLKRRKRAAPANPHDLVWERDDGRPIDPRADWDEWHTTLAELGLPAVRPHSARHTCATTLLSLGVPETIIMQLVGHSTILAARRYLHADLTAARKAAGQLEKALGVTAAGELE